MRGAPLSWSGAVRARARVCGGGDHTPATALRQPGRRRHARCGRAGRPTTTSSNSNCIALLLQPPVLAGVDVVLGWTGHLPRGRPRSSFTGKLMCPHLVVLRGGAFAGIKLTSVVAPSAARHHRVGSAIC